MKQKLVNISIAAAFEGVKHPCFVVSNSFSRKAFAAMITLGLVFSAAESFAAGFAAQDLSASALGLANAFTAQADDPSAMAYNPAGIAWQPGTGLMLGGVVPYRNSSAVVASGVVSNGGEDPAVAHFYANWMPLDGHWGVGFGVNSPFMLDNQWGPTVFGGQANQTRLKTFRTSLDVIYALDSRLALAVGGDWYVASGDVNSIGNSFHGTEKVAFGGHGSLMWKFHPGWSLGAMYRFSPGLKLSGDNIAAVSGPAHVSVQLPDEARIGLSYDIQDNFKLEIDGSWTGWSTLSDLNIVAQNGQLNPLNMEDSFGFMAGLRWTWRENNQIRFGYAFDQAASLDNAFSARLTDADQQRVSLGFGADGFGAHLDTAFIYTFLPDRTIANGKAFDGTYRDRRFTLAISVSALF
ncbi:MAG: OmpP1/FadL family transporter [Mariprofundaceae bacterium]